MKSDELQSETLPVAAPMLVSPRPFVVGIGASAGGLEALERFFEHMPPKSGLTFVVIQHLSPDFKSLTDTLLARRTAIPICQAENGQSIEPNVCYLLPPRKDMIIADSKLLLTDKDPSTTVALPIDRFFRSLAQDQAERSVAIVLSGTGSDGSRGVRDIRTAGGLVIAQNPETAKFDGMPKSTIATGAVDFILAPEDMPAALVRHVANPEEREPLPGTIELPLPVGMDAVFHLLRDGFGVDFTAYKPETVTRRIERRLGMLHLAGVEDYVDRLAQDPNELNALYKDLLIGVTRFFRDAEAFDRLGRDILPRLLANVGREDEFRVWVAGCATGEEAYSLAILIQECLDTLPRSVPVKIFATDVHRVSLDVAGSAIYNRESLKGLSPERLDRFFIAKSDTFQVVPELRKQVVFAQHNVLKDAPFTRLDLVVCRNLLIYFLPAAQKKVLSLFHFGLRTGGALFLGPSEGPGDLAEEFDIVNPRWKIYRKRRNVRLANDIRLSSPTTLGSLLTTGLPSPASPPSDNSLIAILDMLLDECMVPGLLVNERRQLVRSFGGASRFLDLQDGWFSSDVLETVRPELRPVLAGALPRAFAESTTITFKGLAVRFAEGEKVINIRVKPLRSRRSADAFALITLDEVVGAPAPPDAWEMDLGEATRAHLAALETDLRTTKDSLQATIEELETSNEELQATNEELTASNEELQSTNEELHSVNEELYTVNGEYQKKIEELTEITADMENLLASTEVHTIFLDKELCVRKFTPRMAETFHLLPQDIGRRIDHFTHTIDHTGLMEDLRVVLNTGVPIERQVRNRRENWFLLRILPYRSGVSVAGVVITLIDIDRLKRIEAEARMKEEQLSSILRNSPNWVFIKDTTGKYLLADEAFKRIVGCDPVGKTAFDIFPKEVAAAMTAQDNRVLTSGSEDQSEICIPHADGIHTYLSIMFPIRDESGRVTALGGIRTDVTPLKKAEADAREAVAQRDRFLAMLSHELRNPLAAIVNSTQVIARKGADPAALAEWIPLIERRARHMARLLEDLLDVARITQGKLVIRSDSLDLSTTVPNVLEEVRGAFETRGVQLHVQTADCPLLLIGDAVRLQQVQVNLLLNAAKYTPNGGQVWFRHRAEEQEAVIEVQDNGAGMTPEVLRRAFELFMQADETLDRAAGGIGVGLTLVRSIVELHGGRVAAHSEGPGLGSRFVVRLPLTAVPPQAPALTQAPEPRAVPGLRLLIVEDDPDIRTSLDAMLQLDGYEVRAVANGLDALSAIEESLPDVAVLDIGLPGMTGYDLAREIRRQFPRNLVLIALTGYGQPLDRTAAKVAGFDHHLTKPLDSRELDKLLQELTAERATGRFSPSQSRL